MHHRGQLMMMQRMIGIVPHLTRQMQERMAQMQAAPAQKRAQRQDRGAMARRRDSRQTRSRFLRALKRNNRREWFKRASRRLRDARARSR